VSWTGSATRDTAAYRLRDFALAGFALAFALPGFCLNSFDFAAFAPAGFSFLPEDDVPVVPVGCGTRLLAFAAAVIG
jgi:hypothetical protein